MDKAVAAAVLGAWLIAGCSAGPPTGPEEVRWDRDQCERCRMVLSDRSHAAQVRQPAGEARSKVHRFDDFGCAVGWLDQQPWRDGAGTEFWVTDYRTGEWIDARTAFFVPGRLTPMEYGLGAQGDPVEGGLTFAQARNHVYEVETRLNLHHGHRPQAVPVPSGEDARDR